MTVTTEDERAVGWGVGRGDTSRCRSAGGDIVARPGLHRPTPPETKRHNMQLSPQQTFRKLHFRTTPSQNTLFEIAQHCEKYMTNLVIARPTWRLL